MRALIALPLLALPIPAQAQDMPGMDMGQMHHAMPMAADKPVMPAMAPEGSGTARVPAAETVRSGLHIMSGGWMLMAHGYALLGYTDQGGPRGDDGLVASTMAMLMAEHGLGSGARLTLRSMFSLDPLIGQRGYPNLFAQGETAHGAPLVDRQHPHDFIAELSARVDVDAGAETKLFLYGGPVGEPALGPTAYVHRASARYLPQAPITHHYFDSTHIAFGVVTAGVAAKGWQLEASAFRGREPDEKRWDVETPKLDSWSVRASWMPSPHWALQVSHGRLESPEALEPNQDEARTTASVQYAGAGLSLTAAFAAKRRIGGATRTAWLGEANWDLSRHHSLFGRVENLANDELFPDHADPLHDQAFRLTRFEGGYAYRLPLSRMTELAFGASGAAYAKPAALDAAYGRNPFSYTLFARLSLGQ